MALVRRAAPFALLTFLATSASADAPAFTPPATHAADLSLYRPDWAEMVTANDTHALLKLSSNKKTPYYGVLDLSSGCITETYGEFARVERLTWLRGKDQGLAAQLLAEPATQAELRQYLAFRTRFGDRTDSPLYKSGNLAWSADGSKIAVIAAQAFFRSRDGGQTYELLETNMSGRATITNNGHYVFYQRCGDPKIHDYSCLNAQEIGIVDMTSGTKPRVVKAGRGTISGIDPTGQKLVFIRDDEALKVVVTHLNPTTAAFDRAFAIAAPPLKPNTFLTIDPSRRGRYGSFFRWVDDRTAKVSVVSMTDGKVLFEQQRQFVGTEVDEDGRLAWGTVSSVRAYGTTPSGAVKDGGAGDRIGWAPGGRLLVHDTPKDGNENATLGSAACKLVQVVRVGS